MTPKNYILGIDTSCDETSLALLETDSGKIISNLISSQVKMHSEYGGVVPELASRAHAENLELVFQKCLQQAGISLEQISSVAVTQTPGLIGCLLVGTSFAKALALRLGVDLYAVNHLEAHLFSPYIESEPEFPFLGLVVSGGHTIFYEVHSFFDMNVLGQTIDDAAGEAFDKGAKLLGLGYPGGPIVDKKAKLGDDQAFAFTRAHVKWSPNHLSFSGLKTALLHHVQAECRNLKIETPENLPETTINNLCASLQAAIVDNLGAKLKAFLQNQNFKRFGLSGGVAMNSLLRSEVQKICDDNTIPCDLAKPAFCTDNAAMVAYLAYHQKKKADVFSVSPQASQKINAKELKKDAYRSAKN